MANFKDRKVEFKNRKRLDVVSISKDSNGEISSMVVDVSRKEGTVTEEGTPLNAESLNILLKFQEFVFEQYFAKATESLTISWIQEEGTNKTKTFRINLLKERFYGKVLIDHPYLSGSIISNNATYIDFKINETPILNNTKGTSTKIYDFYVEFYSDELFKQYVTKLKGTVNYTNTSVAPLD